MWNKESQERWGAEEAEERYKESVKEEGYEDWATERRNGLIQQILEQMRGVSPWLLSRSS
jgi:hypothetical protein